jgi:hypothetical protein
MYMNKLLSPAVYLLVLIGVLVTHAPLSACGGGHRPFNVFSVKGVVSSENGEIIPGVSVTVKGTTLGTTTDAEGAYNLSVSGSNAILVFSLVGYDKQEVIVGSQTTINIVLKSEVKYLN